MPKTAIDAAIARGQGISPSGGTLEQVTLEAILPPSVAVIIECETDNKARTMQDIRSIIKMSGGASTPTMYMFQKMGRIVFNKEAEALDTNRVLDVAIDAGAEDVTTDAEGNHVVSIEPSQTISVAEILQRDLGVNILSSEIGWTPNEDTKVPMQDLTATEKLSTVIQGLRERSDVSGIFANAQPGAVAADHPAWMTLESRLD